MRAEFYQKIKERDMLEEHLTATVLSGTAAGEKILVSGSEQRPVYAEGSFWPKHLQELKGLNGTGRCQIDGCEVFYEQLSGRKKMVICGAGHVGLALTRQARQLGFHVTVIDDRPLPAGQAGEAGADRTVCDDFCQALDGIRGDRNTWFVIMTRGHRSDAECLQKILPKPWAYLGMMGSRRKTAVIREQLREQGYPDDITDRIHMPIGLDIGAETPEEIAVSILAEIIQICRGTKAHPRSSGTGGGYPDDILECLTQTDTGTRWVLGTIVGKRGSSPRKEGTKMLIGANGQTIGTIGGGCGEAEVIRNARAMMRHPEKGCRVITIDNTEINGEKNSMACGGVEEVLLETIGGAFEQQPR